MFGRADIGTPVTQVHDPLRACAAVKKMRLFAISAGGAIFIKIRKARDHPVFVEPDAV